MKTAKFLLAALVLGINTFSYSQEYQRERDSIERIRQMMVNVDSMAPATDPAEDSILVSTTPVDSLAADTSVAKVSSPQNEDAEAQPLIIIGWSDEKTNYLIGIGGLILFLLFLNFKESIFTFLKSGALKFKRRTDLEKANEKLSVEKVKTQIVAEKVKRKADAMTKLGKAAGVVIDENGAEKPEWKNHKDVMRFISFLLEGKWFLHWNPKRFLMVTGSLAGLLICASLFIMAFKTKPAERIVIIKTEPQPIITPTVAIVDVPEIEDEPAVDIPEAEYHPTVSKENHADIVFYVNAFVDENGKPLYKETVPKPPLGWQDDFWPEEDVWCLVNPNDKNCNTPPFKYGADKSKFKQIILPEPSDLAFASRCGHNTRVKVVRSWIGNSKVFS